jgi:crotonobetainyl-CoA:carnitine CoA-transferase CaiB-like acyl-CoA transferase
MLRHALDGLTVLDFTQIVAGPACTMLLADMGASVLKVEAPDGDLGRRLGPAWIGEDSAIYHAFNRNKRSLCLDLKTLEGAEIARRLAARADVVVESMRPGVMDRLGLGYRRLAAENPRLVYCSISAYGQDGPYAGHAGVDGIIQADSGLMSIIGTPGAEPSKVQAPVVDVFTGYVAATGILAKLVQRARDGRGGHLDVNLFNAAIAMQQASLASFLADGVVPERIGSAAPYSAPNEAFETADGWIMVAAYIGDRWQRLCDRLGCPELADDPRFATSGSRLANRAEMRRLLGERFRARSTANWVKELGAADILCAPVSTYADLSAHPQLAANRMVARLAGPDGTTVETPGFPIDSAAANAMPHAPAPGRGEHSREVLAELGYGGAQIERLVRDGAVRIAKPNKVAPRRAAIGRN